MKDISIFLNILNIVFSYNLDLCKFIKINVVSSKIIFTCQHKTNLIHEILKLMKSTKKEPTTRHLFHIDGPFFWSLTNSLVSEDPLREAPR